jgi:serine/threonine protein kinase
MISRSFHEKEIQLILSSVLLGLKYIHDQGYVHKVLHPSRVSLTGSLVGYQNSQYAARILGSCEIV